MNSQYLIGARRNEYYLTARAHLHFTSFLSSIWSFFLGAASVGAVAEVVQMFVAR